MSRPITRSQSEARHRAHIEFIKAQYAQPRATPQSSIPQSPVRGGIMLESLENGYEQILPVKRRRQPVIVNEVNETDTNNKTVRSNATDLSLVLADDVLHRKVAMVLKESGRDLEIHQVSPKELYEVKLKLTRERLHSEHTSSNAWMAWLVPRLIAVVTVCFSLVFIYAVMTEHTVLVEEYNQRSPWVDKYCNDVAGLAIAPKGVRDMCNTERAFVESHLGLAAVVSVIGRYTGIVVGTTVNIAVWIGIIGTVLLIGVITLTCLLRGTAEKIASECARKCTHKAIQSASTSEA